MGSVNFTLGSQNLIQNVIFKTTSALGLVGGANAVFKNVKVTNTSATASRNAITLSGSGNQCIQCEAISYRGNGISIISNSFYNVTGCYIHDSNVGISMSGGSTSFASITNNIIEGCVTDAFTATNSGPGIFIGSNTLYGAENKLGIGINTTTGLVSYTVTNNIIYGFATGISDADVNFAQYGDYNDFYNNTNDVNAAANWQKGPHDIAVNPSFTNVVQRTGSTATTTAGNHLVQSGATFQTWGITAGVDFVYIKSGTGVTAGIYGILSVDSETQITVDITLTANATADKVWQITQGHNFLPTGAV
jgi:hypothetical protein